MRHERWHLQTPVGMDIRVCDCDHRHELQSRSGIFVTQV